MFLVCIDDEGVEGKLRVGAVYLATKHPDSYYEGYFVIINGLPFLDRRFKVVYRELTYTYGVN